MPSKEVKKSWVFLDNIDLPTGSEFQKSVDFFTDTSKKIFDECKKNGLNLGEYIRANYENNEILLVYGEDNLYRLGVKEKDQVAFDFSATISPTKAVLNQTERDFDQRSSDLGSIYDYLTSLSKAKNKQIKTVKDLVEK